MSQSQITLPIIGVVHSPLKQKFGTPRQPNLVDINATITVLPPYNDPTAFADIEQFSHLWIIWQFHQNRVNRKSSSFRPTVRPPRLGGNQKIGVFATRSMYRPANIGLSVVRLSQVEVNDKQVLIHIIGSDMVDGTPVIDIKPYLAYSDSISDAISGYAEHLSVEKKVKWQFELVNDFSNILKQSNLSQTDLQIIEKLIAQDPRPAYRQQELHTDFVMRYSNLDIHFCQITENTLQIQAIDFLR